jgi:glycosyltransferase involved in cell wall biosynthesis
VTYSVAFDATPLAARPDDVTGHTMRGIGRYIEGLLDALVTEESAWADQHLRTVVVRGSAAVDTPHPLVTRRPTWRRQDVGWLAAWMADRSSARRAKVALWHGLDPNLPLLPLPAGRTVRTVYDLIPLQEPDAMSRIRPHRRVAYRLFLRALRRSRLVLAISEATADDVHALLGVPRDRIRVVYPPLTVPSQVSVDGLTSPPGSSRDLLFVGVPDPTKRAELAISTLGECRRRGHDIRLRFCGYLRPDDRARLRALAEAGGLSNRIDFLGRVDDALLNGLYRDSVLLAISRREGFGLPPAEAVLAGGRVVATSLPAYREVLGNSADFARSAAAIDVADAYEAALQRAPSGPPPEMVERFSPRATAASLVSAYEEAVA